MKNLILIIGLLLMVVGCEKDNAYYISDTELKYTPEKSLTAGDMEMSKKDKAPVDMVMKSNGESSGIGYDYGEVEVGESESQVFAIYNSDVSDPRTISRVELTAGDVDAFEIAPITLPYDISGTDPLNVEISFLPQELGETSATVTIEDQNGLEYIFLEGTGIIDEQRQELINFYNSLESTGTLDWPVDDLTSDYCDWSGVNCSYSTLTDFSITGLRLQGTSISFGSATSNPVDLPNLLNLNLEENQLTSVPDFSNLINLEILNLIGNHLTSVPDFSNLVSLERLVLARNRLTSVPDFSNLNSLISLSLSYNQLSSVPDFRNLTSLEALFLDYNPLTSVPDFSNLTSLEGLIIRHNPLTSVPDFSNLSSLTSLNLSHNQLSSVPDFRNLTSLTRLFLLDNQLTSVPDFSNLTSLEGLDLNNNQLTSVPGFTNLSSLEHLFLENNKLNCYPLVWETQFCSSVNVLSSGNPGLPTWDSFCSTGEGACVDEVDEQIEEISTDLDESIADGSVDEEGAESLYNQLGLAEEDICDGDPDKAVKHLENFIKLVNAKMPNKIDEATGLELIAEAEAIIDLIESGDYEVDCDSV